MAIQPAASRSYPRTALQPWGTASPCSSGSTGRPPQLLQKIPGKDCHRAASTAWLPHLAQREGVVRFPNGIDYAIGDGQERTVDWGLPWISIGLAAL